MCYIVYTNAQRQGTAVNMTVGEVQRATQHGLFKVIARCSHKTSTSHGLAKIILPNYIYDLLQSLVSPDKKNNDLVFTTSSGQSVTNVGLELEKLGDTFREEFPSKQYWFNPVLDCKTTIRLHLVSTAVGLNGTEQEERAVATMMSHSVEVARRSYQHTGTASEAVRTYQTIHTLQAGD